MNRREQGLDRLFQAAEQLANDFSLFPRSEDLPQESISGLLTESQIEQQRRSLRDLDVDRYIEVTVLPTEQPSRPGAMTVLRKLPWKIIREIEMGPLYCAEMVLPMDGRERRVGVLAQDRGTNRGAWLPEHHRRAVDLIREFADCAVPLVTFMDTPGAAASEAANQDNQAHSISRLIAEMARLHVPIVGIIFGIGYSGGAIPLATSNVLLSVRDGVFSTIQPQGLANIARKYNLSWQECARSVGVSSYELYHQGCIDGIIDYVPGEDGTQLENLSAAITSSILAVEQLAMHFVESHDEIFEHYRRSMHRFVSPSETLKDIQTSGTLVTLKSPTHQMNVFGVAYRYLRYLGLRRRIRSTRVEAYGRLSVRQIPHGDLAERVRIEYQKAFDKWHGSPLNVRYDDALSKSWRYFASALRARAVERGPVRTLFLGSRKESYDHALEELRIEYSFHLYNLWKEATQYNFLALIRLLADPRSEVDPDDLTVLDVVSHPDVVDSFVHECENLLIFDLLYDNIIVNLPIIAGEAREHNVISRDSVARLLEESLTKAIHELVVRDQGEGEAEPTMAKRLYRQFSAWIGLFVGYRRRGAFLKAVGEWKRIAFPRVAEPLFAIVTHFLDHLLPSYLQSERLGTRYDGRISPRYIGVKDFWNRVNIAYGDLLIGEILLRHKKKKTITPADVLERFFVEAQELQSDRMTTDPVKFPGFRISIEDALAARGVPCGTLTAVARFRHRDVDRRVGVVVSNLRFQAGSFDMASAEKFARLLVTCASRRLPVVCFISSGGMQTKEGAGALFSMAIVNDRITRFVRDNDLPVICFGFGDCTGGAQASLVTHPLVWTYYFSGANMPFAGQIVVPAHLPLSATLSNYLSEVPQAMDGLVRHPFAPELDEELRAVDPDIPIAEDTVEEALSRILQGERRRDRQADEGQIAEPTVHEVLQPLRKVIIHARGCTAVKLLRTTRQYDIRVVLVQSDPDMESVAASMIDDPDTLICLGGNTPDESYLNARSVIRVAEREGADAVHPGIGFLAENAAFARLCRAHNLNFVGPSAHSMELVGNKSNAIQTATRLGIPVVPGSHGIVTDPQAAADLANSIGYPVLIKAVHGGGGKGIRVVEDAAEFKPTFLQIMAEARSAFGNGDCYLEKYVTSLRHIEVQILRDGDGHSRVLGLRDCSVQRNKQKLIEESGSTLLPEALRDAAYGYAQVLADEVDYLGAGTVEFIFDLEQGEIYFMEMNARLQVEHPVTERVTGIDIVKAQLDIAGGASIEDLRIESRGYAVELRINAERAERTESGGVEFIPAPGTVTACVLPENEDVQVISAVAEGSVVSPYYDSLIAQIVAHGEDREDAVNKLLDYLDTVRIEGVSTNIPLFCRVLEHPTFRQGQYDTNFLEGLFAATDIDALVREVKEASGSGRGALGLDAILIEGSDELRVVAPSTGIFYLTAAPNEPEFVKVGERISIDHTLCTIEAMKLFRSITLRLFNHNNDLYASDKSYEIVRINPASGQAVTEGDLLFVIRPLA